MMARTEASKALDESFRAAPLLTGSDEAAEYAVMEGIAALECGCLVDDALLVETVKSAIEHRADFQGQSGTSVSQLPRELGRLFLLAPISRDCFVLRVLLGIAAGRCSRILHLGIEEFEEMLCGALQELPRLGARSPTWREITQTQGLSIARRATKTKTSTDARGG